MTRPSSRHASARSATCSPRSSCRQGVPMLLGGDEIGRTQGGNNNGYAQDNEISWFDWSLDRRDRQLLAFTRSLDPAVQAPPRAAPPPLLPGSPDPRIAREGPHLVRSRRLRDDRRAVARAGRPHLAVQFAGDAIDERGPRGERIVDDTLLSSSTPTSGRWRSRCRTTAPHGAGRSCSTPSTRRFTAAHAEHDGGAAYRVAERSVVCLRRLPRHRRARRD